MVTDEWGAVQGYRGLYIGDASLFPGVPPINPYMSVITLAERLSAHWRDLDIRLNRLRGWTGPDRRAERGNEGAGSMSENLDAEPTVRINGVHHLAISTRNSPTQIEFFSDVLGAELAALFWMHGVPGGWHGFCRLNDHCSVAFVQLPANSELEPEFGLSHAGTAAGSSAPGTMQHLAFNVDTVEQLMAMRDRIRFAVWTSSVRSIAGCANRSTSRAPESGARGGYLRRNGRSPSMDRSRGRRPRRDLRGRAGTIRASGCLRRRAVPRPVQPIQSDAPPWPIRRGCLRADHDGARRRADQLAELLRAAGQGVR